MPTTKEDFLNRIKFLRLSLQIEATRDESLKGSEHNQIAKLLRNGVAVVGFASLEEFIKRRISKILLEISNTTVKFDRLPNKLKHAVTFDCLSALNYQMKFNSNTQEDKIIFTQEQASKIASTATDSYNLTEYAFGYAKPNINSDDVAEILKAFGFDDPWVKMTNLASKMGLTALPLKNSFENAAKRRHAAAHIAYTDTPQVDLEQFVKEALSIAVSYDCLLTHALKLITNNDNSYLRDTKKINGVNICLRFIKYDNRTWIEIREKSKKAYRRSKDYKLLIKDAILRSKKNNEALLIFDDTGNLNSWHYN
jgi:hypothetical protein